MRHANSQKLVAPVPDEDDESGNGSWLWWSPKQNSIAVAFCNETSIHGFKFIGQEKRHISERIFWLIGFFLSLGLAVYLIYSVWDRYQRVPVIVSFQSSEQEVDSIPFPAVTLCNMNKFPKSKVEQLRKIVQDPKSSEKARAQARKELVFVRNLCNSQQSFAKEMGYAFSRGSRKRKQRGRSRNGNNNQDISENDTFVITEDSQIEMTDFFMENSLSCDELVRLCMLGEEPRNCSELFKPIITDYGKCCTFNILPIPLLLRNPQTANNKNASIYDNPVLGSQGAKNWPPSELHKWRKWDYDDGFVIGRHAERPWRQKRAGLPYGLSILVDPSVDEYFCPASDSEGMRYILHTPLEMPHVLEFSSVVNMGKEVLIEVHPDITNADDDIRKIDHDKRLCYFGKERPLKFFRPYTGGNCNDECLVQLFQQRCNCSVFYMPNDDGVRICDTDPESKDYICIEAARRELQANIKELCGDCDTLCEDIAYNYETTIAELQPAKSLWGDANVDVHPNGSPNWLNHKMSVVHIFFGAESTVPKYRKRLYGTTDLIANTGGILGLCLGFSILSGVEVVYFITIRSLWKYCRKRRLKQKQQKQNDSNNFINQMLFHKPGGKVIHLNPNRIPIYPHNAALVAAAVGRQGYQNKVNDYSVPQPYYINGIRQGSKQFQHLYNMQ